MLSSGAHQVPSDLTPRRQRREQQHFEKKKITISVPDRLFVLSKLIAVQRKNHGCFEIAAWRDDLGGQFFLTEFRKRKSENRRDEAEIAGLKTRLLTVALVLTCQWPGKHLESQQAPQCTPDIPWDTNIMDLQNIESKKHWQGLIVSIIVSPQLSSSVPYQGLTVAFRLTGCSSLEIFFLKEQIKKYRTQPHFTSSLWHHNDYLKKKKKRGAER